MLKDEVSLYKPELSTSSDLPWANRTEAEWSRFVSKEEAARLCALASKVSDRSPTHFPSSIGKFQLGTAIRVFWQDDYNQAFTDSEKVNDHPSNLIEANEEEKKLGAVLVNIFSNPDVHRFLLTARWLLKLRKIEKRKNSEDMKNKNSIYDETMTLLGWDFDKREKVKTGYYQLVDAFSDIATLYVHQKGYRIDENEDEREAIVNAVLTESVFRFYWETTAIDPTWTARKFLSYVFRSVNRPPNKVSDASSLRINSGETMLDFLAAGNIFSNTEMYVLNILQTDFLKQLITSVIGSEQEAQMVNMKISGATSVDIAKVLGVCNHTINKRLEGFRNKLLDKVQKIALAKLKENEIWLIMDSCCQTADEYDLLEAAIKEEGKTGLEDTASKNNVPDEDLRELKITFQVRLLSYLLGNEKPEFKYHPKNQKFWDDFLSNLGRYRELFRTNRMMLRPYYRALLDAFFANADKVNSVSLADKDELIDLTWESFSSLQRVSIRRHVQTAIDTISTKPMKLQPEQQKDLHLQRYAQAEKLRWIKENDPAVWNSFTERERQIIERLYFSDPEQRITKNQVAKEIGIRPWTISRDLDKIRTAVIKAQGRR